MAAIPEAGETAAVEAGTPAEPVAEIAAAEDAATEYAEAVETGQASEAAAIAGVETAAPDPDVAESAHPWRGSTRRRRIGRTGIGKSRMKNRKKNFRSEIQGKHREVIMIA